MYVENLVSVNRISSRIKILTLDIDNMGLMVQCDQCEVWQHCECVGLEEQDIPDQYYCEECKPENHSVIRLSHGR